jgi:hypothetical protein
MEPVITVASKPQNIDPYESLTLDQARERIRMLLSNEESNAWDIGDLLNAIERGGGWRALPASEKPKHG